MAIKKAKSKAENPAKRVHLRAEKAIGCVGIAALVFALCSCVSFDIADWPSRFVYPHNKPTANWCGPIGAFCAYYLLYYVGPGTFVLLVTGICLVLARLGRAQIGQPVLRAVGLVLVTVAASSSYYCLWPYRAFGFPMGSGGVLGVGAMMFLRGHFAAVGSFILIAATWVVGLVLLADSAVLAVLRHFGLAGWKVIGVGGPAWSVAKQRSEALSDIWRKLSAKQKPLSVGGASARPLTAAMVRPVSERVEAPSAPVVRQVERPAPQTLSRTPTQPTYEDYVLPPLELLAEPEYSFGSIQEKVVKAKAAALEQLLSEFNIIARVVEAETGPVVTMFELELAAGVKVSQITTLSNDMARALGAGSVRVVAPLPGRHTIGIEVPNSEKEKVRMKDMMQLAGDRPGGMQIPLFLGKDSSGEALVSDLTTMPHLLIAGTTGSGKSVCINTIIAGILLTKRPDALKLILVDPKMVEMTAFNTIPHLMCPIVTETQRAVQILEWATVKMDERYALLAEARVKNVAEFNKLTEEEIYERFQPSNEDEQAQIPKRLPYIVIVIDELADLMMTAPKEIEAYVVRLAQKSRAVGIHLVVATQRPQATVVTGLIKSNMPTRIGFRVAARLDSRIVLDQNGAETLLGQGDMLFLKPGTSDLVRAQGTYVDEPEIKRIVKHLRQFGEPQFHAELTQLSRADAAEMPKDELFDEAARVVLETQRGSVSLLQRRLSIGYARASRIIEMMAAARILGEYKGSQAREVLMTVEEYEQMREAALKAEAEAHAEYEESAQAEDSPEAAYVNEGQRGYVSVEEED